jgi:hypothetical protein
MTSEAQTIADTIQKAHLDFEAGQILLWDMPAVRPNDNPYRITTVAAHGNRLDIHFDDKSTSGSDLSVFDPSGLKLSEDQIEIGSASRISWTTRGATPGTRCRQALRCQPSC